MERLHKLVHRANKRVTEGFEANWQFILINYPKQRSYLRVKYLDKNSYDVHEYVWIYNTNVGLSPRHFTTAHRYCSRNKNQKQQFL